MQVRPVSTNILEQQRQELPDEVTENTVLGFADTLGQYCDLLLLELWSRTEPNYKDIFCMVSIDEAQSLTSRRNGFQSDAIKSQYHNLERVLTYIRHLSIFFVFISTDSSLARHPFVPIQVSHPSATTIRVDGREFFPPVTELSFDLYSKDYLKGIRLLPWRSCVSLRLCQCLEGDCEWVFRYLFHRVVELMSKDGTTTTVNGHDATRLWTTT